MLLFNRDFCTVCIVENKNCFVYLPLSIVYRIHGGMKGFMQMKLVSRKAEMRYLLIVFLIR